MTIRDLTATLAVLMTLAGCGGKHAYPTRDAGPDSRREGGLVNVNGGFNACPDLVLVASPTRAPVGTSIEVSAHASDADKDPLVYLWEADSGTFANPKAADTTYLCAMAGVRTISVTVSDGSCDPKQSLAVTCVVSDAGAEGAASDGGGSDRGSLDTGASDRGMTIDAGSGGATGSGGGPGSGGTGGMVAGDAGVDGRDAAGGTGGGAGGSGGGAGGTGGSAGPAFEPSHPNPACNACTSAECNPQTEGCQLFTDSVKRQKCLALYACIRSSNCSMDGNSLPCWCGTATMSACTTASGSANGPCASQFEDAAETSDPAVINERFINQMFPIGAAVNLDTCRGSFCAADCQ